MPETPTPQKSYIKFNKIFLSGNLINPICNRLVFLFRPTIAILLTTLAILSLSYFFLSKSIPINDNTGNSLIIFLGSISLLLFHELGHCTALRFRKLESKGIGVGIYFLFPVLFAEVTPAWKLPSKERIAVDLGGFYFQGILTLIYFLLGKYLHDSSFINLVYFSIMLFVFNLNPFLKSDIYWSISDYLNLPNLHEEANNSIKCIFDKNRSSKTNPILLIYALGRYLFFSLVVYLVVNQLFTVLGKIIISEQYHLTFWNVQRDLLTIIASIFLLFKIKNLCFDLFKRLFKADTSPKEQKIEKTE